MATPAYLAGAALRYGITAGALYKGAMAVRRRFRRRGMRRRFTPRSVLGKRGRVSTFGPNKRARFGRRFQASTAQRPFFLSNRFRSRRIGTRRWKSILWRDTLSNTHYRSVKTNTGTFVPTDQVISNFVRLEMMLGGDFNVINDPGPFWTAPGGLQPNEIGATLPTFGDGDIVLRGGMAFITFAPNANVTTAFRIKVWVVKAQKNPSLEVWNAITVPTDHNAAWDPSIIPEFRQDFGKIMMAKEVLLQPGSMPVEFKWRQTVQKIDQPVWQGVSPIPGPPQPGGDRFYWMYQMIPTTLGGVGGGIRIIRGYNVSFTGDAL